MATEQDALPQHTGTQGSGFPGAVEHETIADTLNDKQPAYNQLVNLATDRPGIKLEIIGNKCLKIFVSDLWSPDGLVKSSSSSHADTAKIAKAIYMMLTQKIKLSVDIETFVGKPYLLHSIINFPDRDIGDAVKYACEARSSWASQRITKPNHELPQLSNAPIHIQEREGLSDKQELIYTINFEEPKE